MGELRENVNFCTVSSTGKTKILNPKKTRKTKIFDWFASKFSLGKKNKNC